MKGLTLVTGSEGLVGSKFVEISEVRKQLHFPKEIEMDLLDFPQVNAIIKSYDFSTVVNFAAYTNVGEAEKQRGKRKDDCWQVNYEGVKNLVNAVKGKGTKIRFVQISTDMVFSGSEQYPGPYSEDQATGKDESQLTWYGHSKAEAERIVLSSLGGNASILRLIYPVRSHFEAKLDYLRKPLELYDDGKLYPLFSDQQISITYIDEACKALDKIILGNYQGVFHASSPDTTTPYELISYMLSKVRGRKDVKKIKLGTFLKETGSSKRRYPKFGGLKVEKTQRKLGIKFSLWKEIIDKLVAQGL